ncbi:multidrug effflux MFS transporter [Nocardiopsis protaetiae]|uniref:multidrug effflux MFS transporter n=1 Tax=Nocardiopsis protaetiae TaxID=3382270 RepID=UPI00387A982E
MTSVDRHTAGPRTGNSDGFLIWLIILLAPIGQMAIDIYVPSLPAMVDSYGTTRGAVQLSVTLYLIAFSVGQLFYGPFSDAVGRRKALLLGVALYLVGGVLCLFAPTIHWFVAARVVQGLGITAASVVMKAIAADRFSGPRLATVMTYMVVSWGMGPIVAPVIGAWFHSTLGWEYSLYFLVAYGVLLLVLLGGVYRETNAAPRAMGAGELARGTATILGDGVFTRIHLSMGLCYGILLVFNLVGPFLVQDVMGHSPALYGAIALGMGVAYFAGVFGNRVLPAGLSQRAKFRTASTGAVVAAALMVAGAAFTEPNLWVLTAPSAVIVFFAGILYPNLMGLGVSRFPGMTGLASSWLGFCLMLCSGLIMLASSLLRVDGLLPLAVLFLACTLGCRLLVMRTLPDTNRPGPRTTENPDHRERGDTCAPPTSAA